MRIFVTFSLPKNWVSFLKSYFTIISLNFLTSTNIVSDNLFEKSQRGEKVAMLFNLVKIFYFWYIPNIFRKFVAKL